MERAIPYVLQHVRTFAVQSIEISSNLVSFRFPLTNKLFFHQKDFNFIVSINLKAITVEVHTNSNNVTP